ncbi:hypothetical protein OEZ85_007201 [Tetradesmus obliquus]|uniref:Uncharacterized protein n=1 Tax=Tetradesmus obliquus TaxID=3088 RepID=A0ABY8U1T3_TETOB|nr:hypothetical protein OEZ85_007201 [Tetradesmus obliquus]
MSHEEQQQQPCGSPKAWQRFYMGYRERFVDDCCIELANGKHNAALFNPARAVVKPLRWGEAADVKALAPPGPPFKLIVGSDLVYYSYSEATPHSRLLLLALQQLAGPESQIYLALSLHHNPQEVENFLRWAEEVWGFSVQRIQQQIPAEYRVADVLVVRLQLLDAGAAAAAAAQARAGTLVRGY